MAWIKTIPFDAATGKLKALYDRVTGPNNNVDNIMMMHYDDAFVAPAHDGGAYGRLQIRAASPGQ